jgi:hypothetical protein
MTIKITTKKLLDSWLVLQQLADMPLPPKAGYQVGHATTLALPLVQNYEKSRIETVKKFAKKDEAGEPILTPAVAAQPAKGDRPAVVAKPSEYVLEDRAGLEAAIADIQAVEVEILVSPITVDSLGGTNIPAIWFGILDWLIVEQLPQ